MRAIDALRLVGGGSAGNISFIALNQTRRGWVGLASLGTDMYASVCQGDIYKQTNGTGDFVALSQTARQWWGLASLGTDMYACVFNGDIYKANLS